MTYEDFFPPIIIGDFTDAMSDRVVNQILAECIAAPNQPIVLYINSDGGYLDSLAPIVEVIEKMPNELITVAMGRAISAGAYLLSFGDQRYCGANSYVMLHEISGGGGGHVKDAQINLQELDRQNRFWMGKVADNCGLTYEQLQKRMRRVAHRDLYLTAEQAKTFGIVDAIGLPQFKLKQRVIKSTRPKKRGRK